jgi:HK97 family phage major capsid protein
MKKIAELRQALAAKIKEARDFRSTVTKENRSMTEEERSKYTGLMDQAENMKTEIVDEVRLQALEMEKPSADPENVPGMDETGYRNLGEFVNDLRFNPGCDKLRELRDMSMKEGVQGGILVPKEWQSTLRKFDPQSAIVRPRATIIPAGEYPDAEVSFPALDQSAEKGVYSGVTVTWTGEGGSMSKSASPTFREVNLKPHEVSAYIVITDKLLRNSAAASALIETLLRQAMAAAEDVAFLRGNGVAKPTGILGHKANILVNRNTAGTVKYDDLVEMEGKSRAGGNYIYLANQGIKPKLMTMVDGAGQLIWQTSARDGQPNSLLGRSLVYNERNPVLGSKGDLQLLDLSHYMIKDGSGIYLSASEHPLFTSNKTIIKAVWNVDGKPWLTEPLTLEDGETQVSPFVSLDIPQA